MSHNYKELAVITRIITVVYFQNCRKDTNTRFGQNVEIYRFNHVTCNVTTMLEMNNGAMRNA